MDAERNRFNDTSFIEHWLISSQLQFFFEARAGCKDSCQAAEGLGGKVPKIRGQTEAIPDMLNVEFSHQLSARIQAAVARSQLSHQLMKRRRKARRGARVGSDATRRRIERIRSRSCCGTSGVCASQENRGRCSTGAVTGYSVSRPFLQRFFLRHEISRHTSESSP